MDGNRPADLVEKKRTNRLTSDWPRFRRLNTTAAAKLKRNESAFGLAPLTRKSKPSAKRGWTTWVASAAASRSYDLGRGL